MSKFEILQINTEEIMEKLVLPKIDLLADFFADIEVGMKRSIRWKKFYQQGLFRKQTSWDHAGCDINLLTLIVGQHLQQYYPGLNLFALLACATLHDLGEAMLQPGDIGDIAWPEKQKNNGHQKKEWQIFKRHFNHFSDYQDILLAFLAPYYLLQYSNKELVDLLTTDQKISGLVFRGDEMYLEKKIFVAIERLLYIIDAAREYHQHPIKSLPVYLTILKQQDQYLLNFAKEIKGFDFFYSKSDHDKFQNFLTKYHKTRKIKV